jgi:hypothetical protein
MKPIRFALVAGILGLCLAADNSYAARFHRGIGPDGTVALPFVQADNLGNQWVVYPGGWIRQNGPQPIYAQGETLIVNGNAPGVNSNIAKMDPKTGELIMDDMVVGACTLERRILLDASDGLVRYIEVVKNTQPQEQTVNIQIQSNLNYGVNNAVMVADPKHHDNQIGWVAMTGVNRAAMEMFAGKNAKVVPSISYEQGNSMVQATLQLDIPPGKSVAVMHFMGSVATIDQGQQIITDMKESKIMATVPPELRREIVNFNNSASLTGDYEILRGDVFDVVELHSGDLMKGTLKEDDYKLDTFYGTIDLPKDQVVALMNVGQYRPRQLVVTSDGQVFGGNLEDQTISLELSSGQVVQVPLSQISRLGYRKRPDEPEQWDFDKPCAVMRSGDRVNIQMPAGPIDVATRYGLLKLDPSTISSVVLQSDDTAVDEIYMTDGSKFAGLLSDPDFEFKLSSGFTTQPVRFPTSGMIILQLAGKVADADDSTPSISLVNQDLMVGTLQGTMKLDTSFDTLQINAPEVKHISHPTAGSPDVQVTLWDNSTVSGELEEQDLQCQLLSGPVIDVPVALLAEYDQPLPRPSAAMIEKIKAAVTDLSAEDWKQRDQAESSLVGMGPAVISVLKDLRTTQPPEAQDRIDAIIKQLSKPGGSGGGAAPDNSPSAMAPAPMLQSNFRVVIDQ